MYIQHKGHGSACDCIQIIMVNGVVDVALDRLLCSGMHHCTSMSFSFLSNLGSDLDNRSELHRA